MMTVTDEDGMTGGTPISDQDARTLRYLKWLVTVLTATMILGVLSIAILLVIRLQTPAPATVLPDTVTLPEGTVAMAFTQGPDWYAIVTADDRILIYDRTSGKLRQDIAITPTD